MQWSASLSSVERYRHEGIARIEHLQLAADPEVFFPLPAAGCTMDVAFVGTHSPRRESIVAGLQDFNTHVYGSAAWRTAPIDASRVHPARAWTTGRLRSRHPGDSF